MYKNHLLNITTGLLHSKSMKEEVKAVQALSEFFSRLTAHEDNHLQDLSDSETIVSGGLALSALDAAVCVDDYLRTARFIKGIYAALQELKKRFPSEKINILYAGCGPYATLITPLLPLLKKEEVKITLLEINEYAVQTVKELLLKLGFETAVAEIICCNALSYQQAASRPLHLLISETMFNALVREPQVAITAHLAPQLKKNGILIPEEISIDLAYTFFGKEPYLNNKSDVLNPSHQTKRRIKESERKKADTLFSMNKDNNFSELVLNNTFQFESKVYEAPKDSQDHPDICLFTRISIFKELALNTAESFITNPHCITAISNMAGCSYFKLIYDFGQMPNWTYLRVGKFESCL